MSYTTIQAVRKSITNTIIALTPSAKHFRHPKYREASIYNEWKSRAGADIDREFSVDEISVDDVTFFGTITQREVQGTMLLIVGHAKMASKREGIDRRDMDVEQICAAIEKKANYPTDVSLIRRQSRATSDLDELHWVTRLTFEIHFAMAMP